MDIETNGSASAGNNQHTTKGNVLSVSASKREPLASDLGRDILKEIEKMKSSVASLKDKMAAETATQSSGGDAGYDILSASPSVVEDVMKQKQMLMKMKRLNRQIFKNVDEAGKRAEIAKLNTEKKYKILQTLQYRRAILLREVRLSANFQTEQVSKIELIDEDAFRSTAPKDLLDVSSDTSMETEGQIIDGDKEHKLFLNRLSHELLMRKELLEEVNNIKKETSEMSKSISSKNQFIKNLKGSFDTFVDAAQPFKFEQTIDKPSE